jgi:hypothetical protein
MPELNVELLLKVKKHILQKPSRLHMAQWLVKANSFTTFSKHGHKYFCFLNSGYNEPHTRPVPECGTVGCIAGWASVLASTPEKQYSAFSASDLLGLDSYDSSKLFFVTFWPEKYKLEYLSSKTQRQRAKIVGQVIDLFIAGNGSFPSV